MDIQTHSEIHNEVDPIEAKLLYILEIYPQISNSMLQITMNPHKANEWKPTLDRLVQEGKVRRFTHYAVSPIGRNQAHTIIQAIEPKLLSPTPTQAAAPTS